MAGFAVDIGDEGAAYEKGVNMPSMASGAAAASGIASIGKGVFGVLDAMDAGFEIWCDPVIRVGHEKMRII